MIHVEADSAPVRVQLSRAKGWRMPPNTVKVDRSTRWGNPFKGVSPSVSVSCFAEVARMGIWMSRITGQGSLHTSVDDVRRELAGKNLACWCKLDAPCHADVLLRIANA